MPPKYWAFISYSHADRPWGQWLHRALEAYRIPPAMVGRATAHGGRVPRRLFPIFRDREELPATDDLGMAVREALAQSRFLIVICSPRAAQSRWVNEEVLHFKRLGGEARVRCLIADGEPGGGPERECFPPAVRWRLDERGGLSAVPVEPVAADARAQGDGRANALLKVLAGVLGVDYDELKRRDEEAQRRRLRKTRALAALFALLAVAAVAAGLYAWQQRGVAQEKTRETLRALSRADFEYGSERIEKGATAEGAAYLARALRHAPQNRAAGLRLQTLLAQRTHYLPELPPLRVAGELMSLEFSPDSRSLLVRETKAGAHFFDAATGELQGAPFRPAGWMLSDLCFFSGATELLTLGDFSWATGGGVVQHKAALQRWDVATRRPIGPAIETGVSGNFPRLAVEPGARLAAVWGGDRPEVAVWKVDTGERAGPPCQVEGAIHRVILAPNGKGLIVLQRKRLLAFDPATGQPLGPATPAAGDNEFEDFRFVGGRAFLLLTGSNPHGRRVWQLMDGATGKPLGTLADADFALREGRLDETAFRLIGAGMDERAHFATIRGNGAWLAEPVPHRGLAWPAFRPDGRQVATALDRHTVIVRSVAANLPGGRTLLATRGAMKAVLSPDGKRLLVVKDSKVAQLHDAATGAPIGAAMPHDDIVFALRFSRDGRRFATGDARGVVKLWEEDARPWGQPIVTGGALPAVEFSPDGQWLLTGTARRQVTLWRTETGEAIGRSDGFGLLRAIGFTPAGREIFFARGKTIEFWTVSPFAQARTIPAPAGDFGAAALSADGKLVAGSAGATVQVWRAADGREAGPAIHLLESPDALVFDPAAAHLLARDSNVARIFRVTDGAAAAPPLRLRGMKSADFSPDGTLLLTTHLSRARLWDWRTGRPVADEFPSVFEATFSADGRQVLRGNSYIAELISVPPAGMPPAWLAPVVEAVFHERLRPDGVVENVPPEEWLRLRAQLAALPGDDYWPRFGRWLAADPLARTVTVESTGTTEDFLRRQWPELQAIMREAEVE